MGSCFSTQTCICTTRHLAAAAAAAAQSVAHLEEENSVKILLLGTLGCGKSSILRQLQKLSDEPRNIAEPHMSAYIKEAVVADMKTLCEYPQLCLHQSHEYLRDEMVALQSPFKLSHNIAFKIKELYKDIAIRQTLQKRDDFGLSVCENIDYFFDKMDDIALDGYEPSFEDRVRFYSPTIGYSATTFKKTVENLGEFTFEIPDVGGARSERRKFLQNKLLLDPDLNTIIYVVAISEYNMLLYEDNSTNRLVESVNMFSQIINLVNTERHLCVGKSFILLFNKYDKFKEKIKKVPITVAFDDFPEDLIATDPDHVVRFIAAKFLNVFKESRVELKSPLRIIRTTAVNTQSIQQMFDKIAPGLVLDSGMAQKQSLLKKHNLRKAGKRNAGFATLPTLFEHTAYAAPTPGVDLSESSEGMMELSVTDSTVTIFDEDDAVFIV